MTLQSLVLMLCVGELSLASHMGGDDDADIHPRLKEFKQKQREVRCAVNLAEKLQLCLDNGNEDFTRRAVEEANELGQSAFGGTLLNVIGTTYVEQVCVCVSYLCVVYLYSALCTLLMQNICAVLCSTGKAGIGRCEWDQCVSEPDWSLSQHPIHRAQSRNPGGLWCQ